MRLGVYEVTAQIGAGGMGEVYRATDTKLKRQVAIKILPPSLAADADRLVRFQREAEVLASLNHPNIAAIYGLEEGGGLTALVMELVDGDDLSQRIARGAIPIDEALPIAKQIAVALEYAHEHGVVHRDLKPANIKVTPNGTVKVLDFGLAKLAERPDLDGETRTVERALTRSGMVLGTVAYMSPEQARGEPLDGRTDLFSLGTVLYEMATGRRAFAKTLDWTRPSATGLPPELQPIVFKLLEQDVDRRYQTAADVAADLKRFQRVAHAPDTSRRRWPAVAAIAAILAGVAVAATWLRPERRSPGRDQWVQLTNFSDSVSQPAISPDGRMLSFIRGPGTFQTEGQVYVKLLPDGEPKQLTHDDLLKMSPVFSPDGSQIAYTTISTQFAWDTWLVPVLGGEPSRWLPNASGLVWVDRQRLLFSEVKAGIHMAIVTAELTRAGARDVYLPAHERGMGHRSYPSPDRAWAVVVEMDGTGGWAPCRLVPLDGSSPGRRVGPPGGGCTFAGWSPDGTSIYMSSSAGGAYHLWRQPFPDGAPEQITSGPTEEEGVALAPDGRSLVTAVGLRQRSIVLRAGPADRQISLEGYAFNPKFTRDGKKLFYQVCKSASALDGPSELWVADVDSGRSEHFFSNIASAGTSGSAAGGGSYDISPDGRRVVLTIADPEGRFRLWLVPIDRSTPPQQIPNVEGHQPMFGPPGEIVFRANEGNRRVLYRVREDGRERRKAIEDPGDLLGVSLDGQSLVVRDGQGATVYPLDGGAPIRVWGRDVRLRWSSDGRSLFLSVSSTAGTLYSSGRTYVFPLEPGRLLPDVPSKGFQTEAELAALPGVQIVEAADVAPGPTASVYAFSRETTQRNLYRIPVPQ